MYIERVTAVTSELVEAVGGLVKQLTSSNAPPPGEALHALLDDSASSLLVAREPDVDGPIVGIGCVTCYHVPTGVRAIIEDVVVDETVRGRGIGQGLIEHLLEIARDRGARGVSLTSNPRRVAANRLYLRMGFALRQTNSYYYALF
jgi:GNAT superfamily N-acetyltransferase